MLPIISNTVPYDHNARVVDLHPHPDPTFYLHRELNHCDLDPVPGHTFGHKKINFDMRNIL
jgi:hypothetical protein